MKVLPTVNLTNHQKSLLAKLVAAPSSPNGGKRVHVDNEKMVNAKSVLIKLGIIKYDSTTGLMDITTRAVTLMQEEGIIDDVGQLTDIGNRYAAGKLSNPESDDQSNSVSDTEESNFPTSEKFHISFADYIMLVES